MITMLNLRSAFAAAILAAASPAGAETLAEKMAPCLACHGEQGTSENENTPSLGGQPAPYALIQVYMFREKMRVLDVMNDLTKPFTDADLQAVADAIAKQPPPKAPEGAVDDARMQRGATLLRQHRCVICHLPTLAGQDNVPRLAAQREDYLVKTMREYKSNARTGYDASMADVLARVSDAEILDLAYAIARHR